MSDTSHKAILKGWTLTWNMTSAGRAISGEARHRQLGERALWNCTALGAEFPESPSMYMLPDAVLKAADNICRTGAANGRGKPEKKPSKKEIRNRSLFALDRTRQAFLESMRNEKCQDAFYDLDHMTYSAGRHGATERADLTKRRAFANRCIVRGRPHGDRELRDSPNQRGDKLYKHFKQALTDKSPNRCEIALDLYLDGREAQGVADRTDRKRPAHPTEADGGLYANACVLRTPRSLPTPERRRADRPIEMTGARKRRKARP